MVSGIAMFVLGFFIWWTFSAVDKGVESGETAALNVVGAGMLVGMLIMGVGIALIRTSAS